MITQVLMAGEYVAVTANTGKTYAIQYRGNGECFFRVGVATLSNFKEGFRLENGDILKLKLTATAYALATKGGSLTIMGVD